jgi:capsular polysaccharide transport system permease protein
VVPDSAAAPSKPKLVPVPDDPGKAVKPAAEALPAARDEKSKVVHIVQRLQEGVGHTALKQRPWVLISVLACIALPTFIASVYFFAIAADRYISEAHFAVRSNDDQSISPLGFITGLPSSQIMSDSFIVADYVGSLEMVAALEERLPLREMYRDDSADFFSRLGSDVSQEELIKYWGNRIDVHFDSAKQTISLEVQAFRPEHAQRIASEIMDIVGNLVNELSANARRDAVQFSAEQLARTELRVRAARQAILEFRVAHNELDPSMTAETTQKITTELEGERSRLASELASLSNYLSDTAPSMQMLKSRIAALDGEIDRIKRQVSEASEPTGDTADGAGAPSGALASVVGQYQELLLEQEFSEKAYTAALASLDRARAEAARAQSYLAIFGNPMVAEDNTYPRRWTNVFVVLMVSAMLWAIGALGFLTVRDHMA